MALLFLLALLLAWPTYGLSLVAWLALLVISVKKQPEQEMGRDQPKPQLHAKPSRRVPSWAGDRQKNEIFVIGIQNRAMNHGVPQAFLQSVLVRKDIFESLVSHSADLENQGVSFVDQQAAISRKLVEMWVSEGSNYAEGINTSGYLEDDGKLGGPSWANEEGMQRSFAAGVQVLSAPDGLSPEALNAMFSLEQPLERAIAIAGAVERQGGSFKDQQFAVKNFMIRWWSELSPSLQDTISNQFRY